MFNFLEVSFRGSMYYVGCSSFLFSTFLLAEIWMRRLKMGHQFWTTNSGIQSKGLEGAWVPDDHGATIPALNCLHLYYREIRFYLV